MLRVDNATAAGTTEDDSGPGASPTTSANSKAGTFTARFFLAAGVGLSGVARGSPSSPASSTAATAAFRFEDFRPAVCVVSCSAGGLKSSDYGIISKLNQLQDVEKTGSVP